MCKNNFAKNQRLAILNDQLDELVLKSNKDDRDVKRIRDIMAEIEELEQLNDSSFSEQEGLEQLMQQYHQLAESNPASGKKSIGKKKRIRSRFVVVLAATLAVCWSSIAFGKLDFFQSLFHWNDEVLDQKIVHENEIDTSKVIGEESKKLYSTYEAIKEDMKIQFLEPNWIPEGYRLTKIKWAEDTRCFSAIYINADGEDIRYIVSYFSQIGDVERGRDSIKISGDVKVFSDGTIDYYIAKNSHWNSVTWNYENVSYTAYGFHSEEEVLQFLKRLE